MGSGTALFRISTVDSTLQASSPKWNGWYTNLHSDRADACSRRRRRQASDYHDVQPYIVPPCTLSLSLSLHTLFSWRELNREMPLARKDSSTPPFFHFPAFANKRFVWTFFFFLKNPFLFLLRPSQFLYLHNIEKNTPSIPVGWLIRGSLPFLSLTLPGRNIWVRAWKGLWSWLEWGMEWGAFITRAACKRS